MIETIDTGLVNVFLLREERTVLVDAGYPGSAPKILEAMERLGVHRSEVSLLVISHGHIDHFGGAAELREHLGAPLLVHQADAACLREGVNAEMRMADNVSPLARKTFLDKAMRMRTTPLEPDLLIDGEYDLSAFGVAGRLVPTPGHSPGSLSMVLEHGEIIVADLIMQTRVAPKRVSFPLFFDDMVQVRRSLEAVLALEPRVLLGSHGGSFTPEEVRELLGEQRECGATGGDPAAGPSRTGTMTGGS